MTARQLFEQIKYKRSFLCVGLDTDINKIPPHLHEKDDAIFEFNKAIVDVTAPYTVAYKLNLAFYEVAGDNGWRALAKTVEYIRKNHLGMFIIADAKRGDIGNTSGMYAKTFFESFDFDSITLSPYMGEDTVKPFFEFENKWIILLALTSNPSAADFQFIEDKNGKRLFESVIEKSKQWGNEDNTMYVVGATQAEMLRDIRKIIPNHFLLIPGVGEQGGSLAKVCKYGMNRQCGLLVNSSRAIIYANKTTRFAGIVGEKAWEIQRQMEILLQAII
ncbi:MAG: orotidine-5'-phosphate decarboxylase [Prevotellaceae bacterium]|jgi:orotidine-5'-phosphate decarboxylase|nr:orotidine-5'-phosphate decarboxylase [Prevotellaceae bacterium]